MAEQNKNTMYYELFKDTPQEARKEITAGRLKGFTDINPMWRIKRLTEVFGPCGIGWWIDIVDIQICQGYESEQRAFVKVNLFVVDTETGETSKPIQGVGGASFVAYEKNNNGYYTNDECVKMAVTDAIGSACKLLGMSADIYFAKDRGKYDIVTEPVLKGNEVGFKPNENPQPPVVYDRSGNPAYKCAECDDNITNAEYNYSTKKYGKPLCRKCQAAAN